MRPRKPLLQTLRAPLDQILGTEAHVRLLRALAHADAPLSRGQLAERIGVSRPGVYTAADRLKKAGIVEEVGSGSHRSVALRKGHPLSGALRLLFAAERAVYDAMRADLHDLAGTIPGEVRSAWIEDGGPGGRSDPAGPVRLGVLLSSRATAELSERWRPRLREIEERYDVSIELRPATVADLDIADEETTVRLRNAEVLYGPPPLSFLEAGGRRSAGPPPALRHADLDLRSLAIGGWLARRLDHDPTLPVRARSWLVRKMASAPEREQPDLRDWLQLLDGRSVPRVQHLLTDPSERATRLRQSNPFLPILTEKERAVMAEETGPVLP